MIVTSKASILYLFFTFIMYCSLFSQDSIPIKSNLQENNLLSFQDVFFKALSDKALGNYQKAVQNLEQSNDLHPNNPAVLFELSKNYLLLNKYEEAVLYGQRALQIEPTNEWLQKHLVTIYMRINNFAKAIEIQEQLSKTDYKNNSLLLMLYYQDHQLEKGKALYITMEKNHQLGDKQQLFKQRFFNLNDNHKKEIASTNNLNELIEAYEKDKNFNTLSKILTLSAQKDNAILLKYSKIGVSMYPAQASVYLMYSKALNNDKNYKEALETLKNGLDFVIENPQMELSFYDEIFISLMGLEQKKEAQKYQIKAKALRKKL